MDPRIIEFQFFEARIMEYVDTYIKHSRLHGQKRKHKNIFKSSS